MQQKKKAAEENGCWLHRYLVDISWWLHTCFDKRPLHGLSTPCEKWIWCSGLTQLKHRLALGKKPLTYSFYLKSFCKYYCNLWAGRGNLRSFDISSDRFFSLCRTLQTIYCLLTLYLRQFSLLTAEMWRALKSSHSYTYQSTQSMKSLCSTLCIHVLLHLIK